MSILNTPDYYRRREARERQLAAGAVSVAIAAIHADMAESYRSLHAEAAVAEQGRPVLRVAYAG